MKKFYNFGASFMLDIKQSAHAAKPPRVYAYCPAHLFVDACHEIISMAIFSFLLIQDQHLSVNSDITYMYAKFLQDYSIFMSAQIL